MTNENLIPAAINDYNVYTNGRKLIGVGAEVSIPEIAQKTMELNGSGIGGDLNMPIPGQFESMEQELNFRTVYSGFEEVIAQGQSFDLTLRAAQQVAGKDGTTKFVGLRIVERGFVKKIAAGKVVRGEPMESTVTAELSYILIENNGRKLLEIDKLNGVHIVNGIDQMAGIRKHT